MEDSNVNRANSGESVKTETLEMVQKDVDASCPISPPSPQTSPQTSPLTKGSTSKPQRSSPAPTTAASNSLPPCRICGEKASGFHYGVNTCEACKGFFRRSLQRKQKYKCSGAGQCKIGVGKRSNCPSCRYTKCLSVGMSKSAIKTGRYTHEKRTQDILEVKQMEQSSSRSPMSYRFDPIAASLQSPTSSKRSSLSPSTSPKQHNSPPAVQPPTLTLHDTSNPHSPSMTGDKGHKTATVEPTTTCPSTSTITLQAPSATSPVSTATLHTATTRPTPAAIYPRSTITFEKSKTFQTASSSNETLQTSSENSFQNEMIPVQSVFLASPAALSVEDPASADGPESSTPTFHSPSALLDNYGQITETADLTMLQDLNPDASTVTLVASTSSTESSMQASSASTTSSSEDKQSPSSSMSPLIPTLPQFIPLSPSDLLDINDTQSPGASSLPPAAMTFDPMSTPPNVSRSSYSNDERVPSMMPLSTSMPPTPPEDFPDYDSIISILVEAHKKYIISHTYTPMEDILQKQTKYFEEFQQKEAMFGSLSTLSQEQYMDVFEKTGIDIDNRQEMIEYFSSRMECGLRKFISFIKIIPGFTDLPIEDQATLVKASQFEFRFCGNYKSFNGDLGVVSLPTGKSLHMKEVGQLWDKDFVVDTFRLAKSFQKLQLAPEEFVLMKCICCTFADRCELKNHAMVEEIQWRLIQCLLHLINKNHPNESGVFAKIIDRITELRRLTEANYRIARNLQIWPALNRNPLFMEMISF